MKRKPLQGSRSAGEHAAADLFARGIWTCGCPACVVAREDTIAALENGFCRNCGRVLKGKRKDALHCNAACRVAAFESREKAKQFAAMPLFETVKHVDIDGAAGEDQVTTAIAPS